MVLDPEIDLMSVFPKPDLEGQLPVLPERRVQDRLYLRVLDQTCQDNDLQEVDSFLIFLNLFNIYYYPPTSDPSNS